MPRNLNFDPFQESIVHIIYLTEISDFGSSHAFQEKYCVEIMTKDLTEKSDFKSSHREI